MTRSITVLGIPIDGSGKPGGTEGAPTALRRSGLVNAIGASRDLNDLPIRIYGERDSSSGIIGYQDVLFLTSQVRKEVSAILTNNEFPVVVGGCCSFIMGAIAGARDCFERVGLCYLDGHMDTYDGLTSLSGECADMPMALLLGASPYDLAKQMGTDHPILPGDVALIGYRDVDEAISCGSKLPSDFGEGILCVDCATLISYGPERVGKEVSSKMESGPKRFWIHLDFDILNFECFPAQDCPSSGGLSWDQLASTMVPLMKSRGAIGLSLACYNPFLDPDQNCARKVVEMLEGIFGRVARE